MTRISVAILLCLIVKTCIAFADGVSCKGQSTGDDWLCTKFKCPEGYRSVFWDTGCPNDNDRCCIGTIGSIGSSCQAKVHYDNDKWHCTSGMCPNGYSEVHWQTGCPDTNDRCCIGSDIVDCASQSIDGIYYCTVGTCPARFKSVKYNSGCQDVDNYHCCV